MEQIGGNSLLYTQPFSRAIDGELLSLVGSPVYKVFNSEVALTTPLSSGYDLGTTHSSIVNDISMGVIMVSRYSGWGNGYATAFYFGGGYDYCTSLLGGIC